MADVCYPFNIELAMIEVDSTVMMQDGAGKYKSSCRTASYRSDCGIQIASIMFQGMSYSAFPEST